MTETIVAGLVLTTTLYITEPNEIGRSAAHTAMTATYKTSGLDKVLEPTFKKLEEKYVNDELRSIGIGLSFFYRVIVEQKIEHTWSF